MEEIGCAAGISSRQYHIQADVEGLPEVAHENCVAVQAVQFLHALEAVVDVQSPGCQAVATVDALLHSSSHVVVFEGEAVIALVRLHHAVLAVPHLRPAAGPVHGAAGHAAVQVVGEIELHIALRGGGVLVQAVRRVGPRHARLGRGDAVSDGVVTV